MATLGRQLLSLMISFALAAGAAYLLKPSDRYVAGAVQVVDGDSLRLGGADIRLQGVDAPELAQTCRRNGQAYPCGQTARNALAEAIAGKPVSCRVAGRDRYGRQLASCSIAGQDLGRLLVERGLAVGYGSYVREERAARAQAIGLWAGEFQPPAEWRRAHPRGG